MNGFQFLRYCRLMQMAWATVYLLEFVAVIVCRPTTNGFWLGFTLVVGFGQYHLWKRRYECTKSDQMENLQRECMDFGRITRMYVGRQRPDAAHLLHREP